MQDFVDKSTFWRGVLKWRARMADAVDCISEAIDNLLPFELLIAVWINCNRVRRSRFAITFERANPEIWIVTRLF